MKKYVALISCIGAFVLAGCSSMAVQTVSTYNSLDRLEWQAIAKSQNIDPSRANKSEVLYDLGKTALARNNEQEALGLFKLALKFDTHHTDSMNGIASILYTQKKYDEARGILVVALKHEPDNGLLKKNLGRVLDAIINTEMARLPEAPTSAQTTAIQPSPALVDLGRPLDQQQSISNSSRQIEVLPLALAGGFERLVNSTQLKILGPNVFELVASTSGPGTATATISMEGKSAVKWAPTAKLPSLPVPSDQPQRRKDTAQAGQAPILRAIYEKRFPPTLLVSNGSGKPGIACGQARAVKLSDALSVKCGDYKDFKQQQTRLFVREGASVPTATLARLSEVSGSVKVIRVKQLPNNLDMHLVLGKDFSMKKWVGTRS
jgi:hypothetical protein